MRKQKILPEAAPIYMIKYSNTYLELDHLVGEAHALLPNDVLHRHADVLKRQNCRVGCLEECQEVLKLIFPAAPTCIPNFEMADLVIPLESIGTTISDLFWCGLPSLVFANRHAQSAYKVKDGRQGSSFKMSSCLDLQPIGDPHLGAVDHQVPAVPPGRRGQRSHIAPSSGLTDLNTISTNF